MSRLLKMGTTLDRWNIRDVVIRLLWADAPARTADAAQPY